MSRLLAHPQCASHAASPAASPAPIHRPARTAARPRPAAALALFLLLSCAALPALAQFAGPSAPLSTTFNRPLTPTTDPAILYPPARDIRLDDGDLLVIHLFGTNDYAPTVRVALDGTIQLPLIAPVQVQGLTVHEAERLIADKLIAAGMYRDPQVTIQVTESPNDIVTITGELHAVVPVIGSKRLYDVLSSITIAYPPTASHIITIDRPGLNQPIIVDLGNDPAHAANGDIPVFPHDTIIISRIGVVYTLGAFKTQTAIPLQKDSPLTLLQALALGGGSTYDAKYKDLRIIRTTGNSRSVITVNVKKIMFGHAPDPVLQADDIVFLPSDALKVFVTNGSIGTLLGVASIMLYAFHP